MGPEKLTHLFHCAASCVFGVAYLLSTLGLSIAGYVMQGIWRPFLKADLSTTTYTDVVFVWDCIRPEYLNVAVEIGVDDGMVFSCNSGNRSPYAALLHREIYGCQKSLCGT